MKVIINTENNEDIHKVLVELWHCIVKTIKVYWENKVTDTMNYLKLFLKWFEDEMDSIDGYVQPPIEDRQQEIEKITKSLKKEKYFKS